MSVQLDPNTGGQPSQASVGQLTSQLSEQMTRLVRDELALARVEMTQRAKRVGLGAGMLGAGGVFAFFAAGAAIAAAILGLATVVAGWLAALIVTAVLGIVAGAVALTGRKSLQRGTPPVPSQAIDSVRDDAAAVRQAVRR